MEKVELTVSMELERLDAPRYFLTAKNKRIPRVELQCVLEELHGTYIPAEIRIYLGTKCRPNQPHPGRTAAKTARQQSTEPLGSNGPVQ